MAFKYGTIDGVKWSGTTTKNARWAVQWHSYAMDAPGISKISFTLYKTQEANSSHNITNACILKMTATKGSFVDLYSYQMVPVHGSTPYVDFGEETWTYTAATGLEYKSGVYKFDNTTGTGRSFKPIPQISEDIPELNYNGTPHLHGEFYIKHNSSGQAQVKFELTTWINDSWGGYPTANGSYASGLTSIDSNYEYTKVTAPYSFRTNVATNAAVSPSSTISFSWYGADHGTNNNIDSYKATFYAATSASSLGTAIATVENIAHEDGVWSSASIDLSKQTASNIRGKWITCKVQTIGENTSYNSDTVPTGKAVLVNRAPSAPTVTQNSTVAPATGGNLSFTATVGSDSDSGTSYKTNPFTAETMATQPISLAYKVGSNGTITGTTSPITVPVTAGSGNVTVYFYTYDGIEYSSATSKTVTRNSRPVITLSTLPTILSTPSQGTYAVASSLEAVEGNGKTGMQYAFGVEYASNSSFSNSSKVLIRQLNSSSSYNVTDIRANITNFATTSSAFYYRFYAYGFDGVDESVEVKGNTYYIPAKPSYIGIYNKLNGNSVSGALASYFSSSVSLKFNLDPGYDSVAVYAPTTMSATLNKTSSYMFANISDIPQTLVGGQEYVFNVNFYYQGQLRYKTSLTTSKLTRVNTFRSSVINDYNISNYPLKIFTSIANDKSISLRLNLTKTDGTLLSDLSDLSSYGISEIWNNCYLTIGKDGNRFKIPLTQAGFAYSDSAGNIQLSYKIDSTLFNQTKEDLNLNSSANLSLSFDILDVFGSYIRIPSSTGIYIDCREPATCTNGYGSSSYLQNYFEISNSSKATYYKPSSKGVWLMEGMYLFFTGNIYSYNTNPVGQIWIKRGGDDWTTYGTSFGFTQTSSGTSSPSNPMRYTISRRAFDKIGKIARKDYVTSFKIVVSTDGGIDYEYVFADEYFTAKEHQSGNVAITNTSYSKTDKQLTLSYVVNNPGLNLGDSSGISYGYRYFTIRKDNNSTVNLSMPNYVPAGNILGYDQTPYSSIVTQNLSLDIEDSAFYGKLKIKITRSYTPVSGLTFTTSYETLSAEITIYNEAPTVSYRKNHLGINTNQLDGWTEAVLVISANNNVRRKILIVNPETAPTDTINYILSIDTYNGTIDGATFHGGSW